MNTNNGKTGNVNIPGALHSTGGDGDGQVGGVVVYVGDIYDTTAGKNLATLNAEFAEGIANAVSSNFSGNYDDLTNKPSLASVATSGAYSDLSGTPSLATVATSGDYDDLIGKPNIITKKSGEKGFSTNFTNHATGNKSFAEGSSTTASGADSHAEGNGTTASGDSAHSFGDSCMASGDNSIAGGESSIAAGNNSFAFGLVAATGNEDLYVFGKYNKVISGYHGSHFAIGNGSAGNTSNTFLTLGDYVYVKGVGGFDGTNVTNGLSTDKSLSSVITDVNTRLTALEGATITPKDVTITAKDVTYDSLETYTNGTVGYEINQLVTSLSAKYVKPGTGVPKTDLANDVLTSLGYADDYNTNKSSFVTSNALNDLSDKVDNNEKTTASALTDLNEKVEEQEKVTSEALNDLNDKIDNATQSANNVSFDDSVTHLSTQGNPINNVQTAIQLLATKIYGYSSTLVITLTYNNGIRVANTVINISAIFQGNNYDFSSQLNDPDNAQYVTTVNNVKKFKTNSSGECRIGLPIGANYELTFNDITNYIKPEPITGITDSTQIIIGASYQAISDYETVILKVVVHGASGGVTPSGKKVYIDTYNQNNTSVVDIEGLYEITLNANGTPSTVKIKEGTSYITVTDNVIKIDKGILYKVRLDDWDDTGAYTKSTSPLFNAQKVNRGVTLAYTYTLSGTYLLLKDLESEDGYKNYRIVETDSTNNKIKIAREINGITSNYWIYKNSNDVYIYEESQDISTAYAWFEGINVDANNPIVGIGFRSQLLNNPSSSARAISGTCAFCVIPYNVANVTAGALRENGASGSINSNIDGLANEESWLEVDSPTSVITKNIHNITASIGNNTYNAFLPAHRQLETIIQNIDNINLTFSIFNKSLVIAGNNAINSNLWSSTVNTQTNTTGLGANGWNKDMNLVGSSYVGFAYNKYKSIPVFPY